MTLDLSLGIQVVVGDLRSDESAAEALVMALVVVVLHRFRDDVSEVLFTEEDVFAERFAGCPNETLGMSGAVGHGIWDSDVRVLVQDWVVATAPPGRCNLGSRSRMAKLDSLT